LRHHAQFSVHGRHRGGRAVWTRLPAGEIHFRHQRRGAQNHLPAGPQPAWLSTRRKGPPKLGRKRNAMNNVLKINFGKRKRLTSVVGLALDGSRLEGVALRRTNGALQLHQTFSVTLSLDPLTAAPELVGREIRNHLDAAGVRERHCVLGVPLKWVLTAHTELPPLPEADAASLLQLEAERGFPTDVATLQVASSSCPLAADKKHVLLAGIPSAHIATLEKVLAAAKLKPASFALGLAALQPAAAE